MHFCQRNMRSLGCVMKFSSGSVKDREIDLCSWEEHELIGLKEALFESDTLAFTAKAAWRTEHPASSFERIYLDSWYIEGKCIKGGNFGKGLLWTQQVCATSVGQKLCCTVRRRDSFHGVKVVVREMYNNWQIATERFLVRKCLRVRGTENQETG